MVKSLSDGKPRRKFLEGVYLKVEWDVLLIGDHLVVVVNLSQQHRDAGKIAAHDGNWFVPDEDRAYPVRLGRCAPVDLHRDVPALVRAIWICHLTRIDPIMNHDLCFAKTKDLRRERGSDVDLFFITGADALSQILTWRGADELFDLAHFIGVSRPGVPLGTKDISHLPAEKVTLLEVPAMAISSTDCRQRVSEDMPIWYLVPDGIVQYINKRGLYRDNNDKTTPEDH